MMIDRSSHANKCIPWRPRQKFTCRRKDSGRYGRVSASAQSPAIGNTFHNGDAIEETKRRWPGVAILTHRHLDDELGVAVYFTFPGGQYMAVWVSGINQLCLMPEDRPRWSTFVSQSFNTNSSAPTLLCTKSATPE